MRMHAPTPQQPATTNSDRSDWRERSRDGGTLQPESMQRFQLGTSPEAELPSSAAQITIELLAAAHEVLRCAFRYPRSGGSTDGRDAGTVDAVRSVCAMARANDVRAETLILAIKAEWRQLPEANGATRMDAEVTLATLITMCIKEYYLT
jgi:hypothetical protein